MPPLPETKEGLEAAGYVFDNEGVCRGCGEVVEWWVTNNGKRMPMSVVALDVHGEVVESGSLTRPFRFARRSHFASCPQAEDFRRKK